MILGNFGGFAKFGDFGKFWISFFGEICEQGVSGFRL
jgi:hypothetical protein